MKLLRHLPNALTCGNLICGCLGIIFTIQLGPMTAAIFIWIACVFDFFDGFAARALNVSSPIGKELDSLADMTSFGVLPAVTMFVMLQDITLYGSYYPYAAILLAVFSALRLAKFNIDENQRDSFIGVPTPAVALLITALPYLPEPVRPIIGNANALLGITLVFSALLVSPFELFALKFKNFSWRDNQLRFTFLLVAVLLVAWLKAGAIPLIILLYIVVSLVTWGLKPR